jgi:two-component system invasion response regulator UvrY
MVVNHQGKKFNKISEQLSLSHKTVNSYCYFELTYLVIRNGLFNAETLLGSE